jgi:hypothetical protein
MAYIRTSLLVGYTLPNGEKIGEEGKDFVGIGRGLIKEISPYFPAGTTESYAEPSAGGRGANFPPRITKRKLPNRNQRSYQSVK